MKRNDRIKLVEFPDRERVDRKMMIMASILFFGVIIGDFILSIIGW